MKIKLLLLSAIFLLIVSPTFALKGVGLEYGTTGEIVSEGKETCIRYGVYNPWDENVSIKLITTGELSNFSTTSETKFVPAKTFHDDSIPIDICFDMPEIYKKNCILFLACEKTCPEERVEYDGLIMATEDKKPGVSGTGSSTTASASAPLKLVVKCEPYERNWVPLFALIAGIVTMILVSIKISMVYRKSRRK